MTVATPDQVINSVYNSISDSFIKSMQSAQSQVLTTQDVNITCSDEAVASMSADVNTCILALSNLKKDKATIIKLCQPSIKCVANNISMKSSLNVTDIIQQSAIIQSKIASSLDSNIRQSLNSLDQSLLLGDNADKTTINKIVNTVSKNSQTITQKVSDAVTQQQGLTLYNYEANNVTMNSVSSVIINTVQSMDGIQEIVTKLSDTIVQELSSNTKSFTSLVKTIMTVGLIVIVLIMFIIFILKRKDTRGFVSFITPYAIFVIGVVIIVAVHLLFKPDYILVTTNTKFPPIDRGKCIFWCSFYAILLGAAEIIYYKIIKKS